MKNKTIATIITIGTLALGVASTAGAAVTSNNATTTKNRAGESALTKRIENIRNKAQQEIDRRIEGLNKLTSRISEMKKISDESKAKIGNTVQSEILNLTNLKAEILVESDLNALKADVKKVTQSHRIYALVMPQIQILVAADKIKEVADKMTEISGKLQTKIDEAKTLGKDTQAMEAALVDMNKKTADALVKGEAAVLLVSSLVPDQGDQVKFQANKKSLVDARKIIQEGNKNLKDARADTRKIEISLKEMKLIGNTATTTSAQ